MYLGSTVREPQRLKYLELKETFTSADFFLGEQERWLWFHFKDFREIYFLFFSEHT